MGELQTVPHDVCVRACVCVCVREPLSQELGSVSKRSTHCSRTSLQAALVSSYLWNPSGGDNNNELLKLFLLSNRFTNIAGMFYSVQSNCLQTLHRVACLQVISHFLSFPWQSSKLHMFISEPLLLTPTHFTIWEMQNCGGARKAPSS